MSDKSNSKPQNVNEDSNKIKDDLSDDPNFWNIESDPAEIDTSSKELKELDELLTQDKSDQSLRPMSEQEPNIELPSEEDILNSLNQQGDTNELGSLSDIASKDVEELLATAEADAKADKSLSGSPKPQRTSQQEKDIKSPIEKMATLVCYLAIIGVFAYLVMYASRQHDFDTAKSYETNTPVQGQYASIGKIETWWSKPMGSNTKFGIVIVPSATITLDPDSTSGVIRSVFYSSEEGLLGQLKPKGDPFTHEFSNGTFLESGTNQITIYGTDGFDNLAHYNFYRSQDETRWTVEVREAPPTSSNTDSFKPLATAPVEPIRK